MRRAVLALLAACGGSTATAPDAPPDLPPADAAPDAGPDPMIPVWHQRADQAVETLLLRYWSPSAAYLAQAVPQTGTLTGYWTFAQAFDAVLDGVERTGGARFAGWVEGLYDDQNARGWSSNYYDDETWMTLALMRAYDLEGATKYLDEAKALYADIKAAWDTTCCGATPGGIWWDRAHTQKANASNAGPVIAGVRLAARTGDASYLAFAKQVYAYWRAHMVDPATYAVTDHIAPGGMLFHYKFTYNEGLMIGAGVALYQATQDATYLDDARHIAGYMLAHETQSNVLYDGTNATCGGDCQQFKGIGFRYLRALYEIDPQPAYRDVLDASATSIWNAARDISGLYAASWAGPPGNAQRIEAMSSATMALNLYAALLGPRVADDTHYEAEDGTVHAIGLEASHAGFAGWGYLAGWQGDGQWVDFHVKVATAGTYHLTFRYAAGAGDASRLVYANGANVVANQTFASTGSWDTWATVSVPVTLAAGANTVSLIYNAGLGSKGYVNLDYLDVGP